MIFIILYIIVFIFCFWILIRNRKVVKFLTEIYQTCHETIDNNLKDNNTITDINLYYKIINKLSYYKLLFSFKPLKFKYWFTEEEIKLLNKFKNE